MKKKVFVLAFITGILLLFISCPLLSWTDPNDYKSLDDLSYITDKTEIKTFSHLKEPIVITMPIWETRYYKGKRKGKTQKFKIGDIYVVIDIEKDEVFDWVYFGGKEGLTLYRPLELGNPVKYYATSGYSTEIISLDPTKTQLVTIDSTIPDCQFLSNNTTSDYALRAYKENELSSYYEYEILDSSTDSILTYKPQIPIEIGLHVFRATADNNGNFYIENYPPTDDGKESDRIEIVKIDSVNQNWKRYDLNLITNIGNETYAYNILHVTQDRLFITKSNFTSDCLLIFKKNGDNYELEKEILTDFDGWDVMIKRIVEVNGNIYIIVSNDFNGYSYVDIYKLTENLEMERITPDWATTTIKENEKFKITFTENLWVRGNRIYFMNSHNTSKIAYRYYDTATGEYSTKPVWIECDKVVQKK